MRTIGINGQNSIGGAAKPLMWNVLTRISVTLNRYIRSKTHSTLIGILQKQLFKA